MTRRCRLLGHSYDPEAAHYYGVFICQRCGAETNGEPPWFQALSWRIRGRLAELVDRWRRWVRACPECGRRFGQHNQNVDHIPF